MRSIVRFTSGESGRTSSAFCANGSAPLKSPCRNMHCARLFSTAGSSGRSTRQCRRYVSARTYCPCTKKSIPTAKFASASSGETSRTLCAKMRRGALCSLLNDLGISKIALGHHFDDAVETFMMSLIYEGQLSCFQPVTYLEGSGITQIRPLLYIREGTVSGFAKRCELPVVENSCPMDKTSKRHEIKALLKTLSKDYPDIKSKIFGSMQRLPLDGWRPHEHGKRPS